MAVNKSITAEQLNKLWERSNKNEIVTYYYVKSLKMIDHFTPYIKNNIFNEWYRFRRNKLINTRFDKHYASFAFFIRLQILLGLDDKEIRYIVINELYDTGYLEKLPNL